MNIQLDHSEILVIAGQQGSGKTRLARQIAELHGSFVSFDAKSLGSLHLHNPLGSLLFDEPNTLIVDGELNATAKERIKDLVTSETYKVNRKFTLPKVIKPPYVIVCTADASPLIASNPRRLRVINLPN